MAKEEGGATLEYYRIPISDESAPEEKDFDQLVAELKGSLGNPGVAFVFSCQMGRGRATPGMVCACIMSKACQRTSTTRRRVARPTFLQSRANRLPPGRSNGDPEVRNKNRGEYTSVPHLLDRIDGTCECTGRPARDLADERIDACAHAQNVVEAIDAHGGGRGRRGAVARVLVPPRGPLLLPREVRLRRALHRLRPRARRRELSCELHRMEPPALAL